MIIAKKLIVIQSNGKKIEYTHVTQIYAMGVHLTITGETDDVDGSRIVVTEKYIIDMLVLTHIEWYAPK